MLKNVAKANGRQVFHGAVMRSLAIKRFVESRILKCRGNYAPVKFASEKLTSKQNVDNRQNSVNKCFRRSDLKHSDEKSVVCDSLNSICPEVPTKFFCLPFLIIRR